VELEEKKQALIDLAETMKPFHLSMAKSLAEGNTQKQAYIDAGGEGSEPRDCASKIISTNLYILEYVDLSKEIALEEAQSALNYTEEQWMADQLEILGLSKGTLKRKESMLVEGVNVGDVEYAKVDLAAANKAQELLGKKLAIFTENQKVTNTVVFEDLTDEELNDRLKQLDPSTKD